MALQPDMPGLEVSLLPPAGQSPRMKPLILNSDAADRLQEFHRLWTHRPTLVSVLNNTS